MVSGIAACEASVEQASFKRLFTLALLILLALLAIIVTVLVWNWKAFFTRTVKLIFNKFDTSVRG